MKKINLLLILLYLIPISLIAQFQNIGGPEGGEIVNVVFVNDTIYTLTSATLLYSVNEGDSWSIVPGSNDLPAHLTNVSVDNGVIYLSVNYRNTIFKSEDFGQTWVQVNDDNFYSQGNIQDFESFNDTLYIYSNTDIFMSPDRGLTYRTIEHLNQSFPFILVHNRMLHFEGYHYYLSPGKLVRTKDFVNIEELFNLSSNSTYRLYRNESTIFLMKKNNVNKTIYKLVNNGIKIYEENLDLTNVNLSDDRAILYDGNVVYEEYTTKYSNDGWYSTNYISFNVNSNSVWNRKLVKIQQGIMYYNYGNQFYKQHLNDTIATNITNNMIGLKNLSIFKSGSKIICGTDPIAHYDLIEQDWDDYINIDGNTYVLSDNLLLDYNKSNPKDSILITTLDGQLFKKSRLPHGKKIGYNDDINCINDLIFVTYLYDSLYVSNNYGESWHAIQGEAGVGRISLNNSNNSTLVTSSYGSTLYASKDGLNYVYYDINTYGSRTSIDEDDNVFHKKNELIYKYDKTLNSSELIPLPFTINTSYNSNELCFELYKNILFVGGHSKGLFVSFNEGGNWKTFDEGLETKNISSIEVDNEYIYVGTFGHVYKRPLSELSALTISGEVFEDINENGVKDINENLVKNIHIRTTENAIIVPTNELGQFSLITNDIAGNKIEIIEPAYSTATNGPILLDITQGPIQLGISFDQEVNDVGIKILSPFVFRPGFNTQVDLYLENLTYHDRLIDVELTLDDKLIFINSSYSPYSLSAANTSYDNILLNGRESKIIRLVFETEVSSNIGDVISLTSNLELNNYLDAETSNNSYNLIDTIRGSFDPNDKSVYPNTDIVYNQNIIDQELLYTIRFQNTGNYPAEFVILRDTFEMNLDVNSIDVLSYSHKCEWQIKDGRVLEVKFPKINLPDSTVSQELSQGYVTFKLKLDQDIENGAFVENKASIYFDYNPPIVTQTVISKIVEPSSIYQFKVTDFSVVPNPSSNYIILEDIPILDTRFKIIDMSGNKVSIGNIKNSTNSKIKISHLTSGQYIIILECLKTKKTYSSTFVKI